MPKNWWFPLDFKIWRTDSTLRRCSLETRGFWIEALCVMHESDTYQLEGSLAELARLLGCDSAEVMRCAVELQRTKTADVTLGNGSVTLVSRRLKRELSDREQTRLRVQKYRCNADVTAHSNSNIKSKSKNKNKREEIREETLPKTATTKQGSRLPEPFFLTSEMKDWATSKNIGSDPVLETEKFVNYWRAKPGSGGVKLDWLATWKNWMLNSYGTNKSNANGRYAAKRTDADVFAESADFYANYPSS